ncbi:uncharacterized protein LOC133743718 [Rosa rugosa]|uniref:uncharacterized protein LOC133743718 n=1 Tax=Rosa rugosa TaxID=74645 RepID=UPI002B40F44B|nr:uncharacterized protein LOC133743718 [Rosa rugosa]
MSNSKSGTKWAIDEEVQLCKSWATITSCGSVGKDQDAKHLWRNIHAHYEQNWEGDPDEVRSHQALESRWKNLKKNLASWHDAVSKAEHYYESGLNNMDKLYQTHMYYKRANKGKGFTYTHCWEVVKDHPKFKDPPKEVTQPSQIVDDSPIQSTDNDEECIAEPSDERPPGRKAQKRDAKLKGKISEKQDRYIQAMENIAFNSEASREATRIRDEENRKHIEWQQQMEVEKQQLELQKVQLEIQKEENWVMAKDTSIMTPESKAWWKKRKKAIRDKTSDDWEGL